MPNANYLKGVRLENKLKAWLSPLDPACHRNFMSRGADVIFRWLLRLWSWSCKSGKRGSISMAKIRAELETHDGCCTYETHADPFPMVHLYVPKFVEMLGRAEAEDFTFLCSEDGDSQPE
jgi:hypothetical protein